MKDIFVSANISPATVSSIEKIIEECDKNKDGEVDYREFCEAMGLKK